MNTRRVLLVDDEDSILRYIGAKFTGRRLEVITASNGKSALARAEAENP